jgi:hypothetical protein
MRLKYFHLLSFGIALSLLSISAGADAQYTYTPPVYTPLKAITSDVSHQGVMSSMKSNNDNDTASAAIGTTNMRYTPSKSRTLSNLQALAGKLQSADPTNGVKAKQLFASSNVIGAVQGVMSQLGLEKNNIAHAYALYWVVYWGLANNEHSTPSATAVQAVARQAERGFAANAEFSVMDNAEKQQAAEELMALTAIMDASSELAKSKPSLARQMAEAAMEGSRRSGLELDKITLTEDGFVPNGKKRSDASDAVPDKEQALASGDASSDGEGLSTTNFALIAAAGGASLVGVFLIGKAMGKKV